METKNSILNALLQQAIFNQQSAGTLPVNLSVSMSSNDDRSEVSSSSGDEDSPADLSNRSHHQDDELGHHQQQQHPETAQIMQAMAAAFSFQRDLMAQQQLQQNQDPMDGSMSSSPTSSMHDPTNLVAKALASATMRRPRSEKKPIPEDLKDNKYYERRRRNNLAVCNDYSKTAIEICK